MASAQAASHFGAFLGEGTARRTVNKPPHPAGDGATFFPYSATTGPHRSGNADYSLAISLNQSSPTPTYRPGDLLQGALSVTPRQQQADGAERFLDIKRVDVRVYCESRTLYWNYTLQRGDGAEGTMKEVFDDMPEDEDETRGDAGADNVAPVVPSPQDTLDRPAVPQPRGPGSTLRGFPDPTITGRQTAKGPRTGLVGDFSIAHEWHRIFADRQTLETSQPDRPLLVPLPTSPESAPAEWPFHIHLPTATAHVSECNFHPGAPRDLQRLPRGYPPTCRDNRNGSVEWVVEAVITLASQEEDEAVRVDEENSLSLDERGLLKPDKTHLVARTTFVFVPSPSAGRGPASGYVKLVRGFTDEPLARVHGAVLAREDGAFDPMSGRLVTPESVNPTPLPDWTGSPDWRRFARTHRMETGALRRKIGMLSFEVALPKETFLRKSQTEVPIKAMVIWDSSKKSRKGRKEVWVEGWEVVLSRRTLSRGGADQKSHQILEPVRNAYFPMSRMLAPGIANQFHLTVDLQSTEAPLPAPGVHAPENSRQIPLATLCPSFKMPNLERDLVFQVRIHFASSKPAAALPSSEVLHVPALSLARVALHLLEEEQEQLPAFEHAVGYRPPLYTTEKRETEWDDTPPGMRSRVPSYRTEDEVAIA